MKKKQFGFTLVEIAIVLVIIGLLLGGILKGQELINSARVKNLADMTTGAQAAYYGFIDRYRRVPGDMNKDTATDAIGQTINGPPAGTTTADNGRLDNPSGKEWYEPNALWEQLSKSGFIQGAYDGGSDAPTTTSNDAPLNAYNGIIIMGRTSDYLGGDTSTPRLNLVIGRGIPVKVLREVDTKLDDGLPGSGVLRLATNTDATFGSWGESDGNCSAASSDGSGPRIYAIQKDSKDCNAVFIY